VWWLVARDEATLTRVIRLSHRGGQVGKMAQILLLNHVNIPRIREVAEAESQVWSGQRRDEEVDMEVHAIAAGFRGDPNVFCVGRQPDGVVVVVTFDGSRPASCPAEVLCRAPTVDERNFYKQLQEEAEDP
jgi:hypothetical protein